MSGPVAVLPMYDRPEIRAATDRFWAALRDRLRAAGLAAPDALDRTLPAWEAWTSPGLTLGQTCGLPYATRLADRVTLVGAPDYGLEGCPPGHYCSVLVVRADDRRAGLAEFAGATAAINEIGSQSGHAALMQVTAPFASDGRFFGGARLTSSHAASIAEVASGTADIAAIDAVSWRLIRRLGGEPAGIRELGRTEPVPCLPFIAALGANPDTMAAAVAAGIDDLDPETRRTLGLRGFVRFRRSDYTPLATDLARAEQVHRLPDPV